jgi:hypothetical protein
MTLDRVAILLTGSCAFFTALPALVGSSIHSTAGGSLGKSTHYTMRHDFQIQSQATDLRDGLRGGRQPRPRRISL